MPTSFSYIACCLFTFPSLLSQKLQKHYHYFYCCYRHYHITLLLNYLAADTKFPGVVELTTQLLILKSILWLPLCRINKFGLNTLPSKTVAIPYVCGLSAAEVQNGLFKPDNPLVADISKHVRKMPQCGSSDEPEVD